MKTISGSNTSSKPISISKSASVMHKFINKDSEASQAVSVYLKRASTAFDELVQFHNEFSGRSRRKHKEARMEMVDNGALTDAKISHRDEDAGATEQGRFIDSLGEQRYRYKGKLEGGSFENEGINSQREEDFGNFRPEATGREVGAGGRIVEDKR